MAIAPLRSTAVATLMAQFGGITPPFEEQDLPGVRASTYSDDAVLIQAVGFSGYPEGHTAIARAAEACIDAGLDVSFTPTIAGVRNPSRIIRRKKA